MSTGKTNPTPEELQAEDQAANTEGQAVSLRFLRRNPRFVANQANADLMGKYIKEGGRHWSDDDLAAVYAEHSHEFEHSEAPKTASVVRVEEPKPTPKPWGELKTRQDVARVSRNLVQYKIWLKNPEFESAVNALLRGEVR